MNLLVSGEKWTLCLCLGIRSKASVTSKLAVSSFWKWDVIVIVMIQPNLNTVDCTLKTNHFPRKNIYFRFFGQFLGDIFGGIDAEIIIVSPENGHYLKIINEKRAMDNEKTWGTGSKVFDNCLKIQHCIGVDQNTTINRHSLAEFFKTIICDKF